MSYGFQTAELRLDSFENIQFFDVSVFSQTTLCLGLLFYTPEPEERQYVPSSPQKGNGVFAKGLNPVRRVSHRGSVRTLALQKVRLQHLCNQELKDPIP